MIKAENLKKEFRVHGNVFKILENIDIEINDGDFIAIMGPSGAGKSTLLNILSTIERPTTGALDSKSTVELLNNFKKINEELKKTIVMVTHDAFAASYAKKVLFIKDGKINLQLNSDGNRKEFFDNIMTVLSSTGGVLNEIV